MIKRKIIIIRQKNLVECDNKSCDYVVPNPDPQLQPPTSDMLIDYLNKPCPECGENLLTEKDNEDFNKLMKTVNWLNKWFGWLSIFYKKREEEDWDGQIKVHEGIHIKKLNDEKG